MIRPLLVGVGYFNRPVAGEKNYYLRLVSRLRPLVDELVVASINDLPTVVSIQTTNSTPVPIYNFRRTLHRQPQDRYLGENNGLLHYHHRHRPLRELSEKTLSLLAILPMLRRIIKGHELNSVLFLDNFGPGMRLIRNLFNIPTAFVAANYDPRGSFYDRLQRSFLAPLDRVLTYTDSYREILSGLGIPENRIVRVRWGVDPQAIVPLTPEIKAQKREQLGVHPDDILGMWSGYIQQIQRRDMLDTLGLANRLVAQSPRLSAIFVVKPEFWTPSMDAWTHDRLRVVAGGSDFRDVLGCADFLLSPVGRVQSTVSPPLTWLEAMSMGVPIVTTAAGAVEEVMERGVSGFVGANYAEVERIALGLASEGVPQNVRDSARQKVIESFNLNLLVLEVVEFLRGLACESARR